MKESKIYFPGLNALRFFAAFGVIVTHIEMMKHHLGFKNHFWVEAEKAFQKTPIQDILNKKAHFLAPLGAELGPLGVVFFFVLSGFLITYLVLKEKNITGRVSAKNFYIRRILRIWPLYFLLIGLGFFVLPNFEIFHTGAQSIKFDSHFWNSLILYMCLLPNLAMAMYLPVPNIGQSWSIGVEEQFYIVWPLIFKYLKRPFVFVTSLFVGLVGLKVILLLVPEEYFLNWEWLQILKKYLVMSKFECMALGAIGAHFAYTNNKKILNFVFNPIIFWASILAIPILLYSMPKVLQNAAYLAYSFCFLIIILNIAVNRKFEKQLELRIFKYLGNISYGLYMYHLLIITAVLNIFKNIYNSDISSLFENLLVYVFSIGLSILISGLSYKYLESPFLRFKSKFQKVKS